MALRITSPCVSCWACLDVCPNDAIYADRPHFMIDERHCTECLGDHAEPQCAAICPIACAIVNELDEPLNPYSSLTGIPLARLRELGLAEAFR